MSMISRPAALAALVLVLAACSSAGASSAPPAASGAPSSPPSGAPSASPETVGAIEHKSGPTDVILRYEEGGGFMIPAWTAAGAPSFTLYGDGTIIFRDAFQDALPAVGSVQPLHPFRTARMNEEQVQTLLEYALREGGLGAARAEYLDMMVSDASTAIFTVNAGGLAKTVSVYALGLEQDGMPDLLPRKTLAALRDHLVDIDQGGSIKTDVYAPERYRAILFEGQPGAPDQKAWPWPDVEDRRVRGQRRPERVPDAGSGDDRRRDRGLGIEPFQGGFIGLPLAGPGDGKFYALTVRPLLPEDTK